MMAEHAPPRGVRRAPRLRRFVARTGIAGLLGALTVVTAASPAAAHGVGGVAASNYETRVLSIDPSVDGIDVEVIDAGTRLALTNDTGDDVLVVGYEGEPYLRVGPDGVFENVHSPTWWTNRTRYGAKGAPPDGVSVDAAPSWEHVSDGTTARFHWHAAHWMSPERPPPVRDDPDVIHHLADWDLVMLRGDERIVASGDLRWLPGPSPFPYLALSLALVVVLVVAGRTRHWREVLVGCLLLVIAAEAIHLVGLWIDSTAGLGGRLLANLYSIAGILLAGVALFLLARRGRDPHDATPLALVAGLFLTVAGGLADLGTLTASVLPTALDPSVARLTVAVTLGAGAGAIAVSAMHLRRPEVAPRPVGVAPPA